MILSIQNTMATEAKFKDAAESAKAFTKRPSDDELLELYALFKQATVGDNDTAKPGMLDLKGKAKWEAWNGKKGVSKEAAMEAYIELVEKLKAEYA
ncbi:acyl-CoA-binding protein homolog isoform X1 [Cryptotermes secundus]|uniref:acyl-CoA-binding protein homolog isoform X1 n=2 Tax=Cryptotermes secundus TaxID=105785 RepID=UPI001454CE53|nr:acyl-CoA-binding protein homolog isoform X1 [Cryptotermes secundus]